MEEKNSNKTECAAVGGSHTYRAAAAAARWPNWDRDRQAEGRKEGTRKTGREGRGEIESRTEFPGGIVDTYTCSIGE